MDGRPDANGTTIHRYKAQYRKKAAEGEEAAEWTAYSRALDATARTLSLTGLQHGATYEVQVRAVSDDEGAGPWSNSGEGRANRLPNATALSISDTTIPWGETRTFDLAGSGGNYFEDADDDTLTYWAESPYPGIIGVGVQGSVLSITALNPGRYNILYGAHDPYGGYTSRLVQITASGNVTREVPENAAAGTNVGAPITATPYNDDYISYGFDGEAATSGKFVINHETGQISVKEGATLDHETKSSYTGRVHWVMYGDQYPAATVTINVADVGAGKPGTPTVTRTTFSEQSNPALDVTWTAAAANGFTITGYEAQYRKKAADGQTPAAWTAYSGTLSATATTLNLANLEAGATYEVQVRAVTSDTNEGAGPWSDTGEGTANTPPTASSAPFLGGTFPVGSIADYRETGQGALGVFFTDADSDTLTYTASAQHPALLGVSLSGAAGEAHLRVTLLNPGTSKVTYTASDPYGGQVSRNVTLTGTAKGRAGALPRTPPPGRRWALR